MSVDPFQVLGMPRRFALDRDELDRRYRELQRALHPDLFARAPAGERRLGLERAVRVNEAYRTLRDELARARELLALHGAEPSAERPSDPEFLAEIMELREELADARRAGDLEAVRRLAARAEARRRDTVARLEAGFDALGPAPATAPLAELGAQLSRLRFFRRLLDEAEAIEDEALEREALA